MADPFGALGLPARPDLTDDEVRSAWRRIAAATHPDRGDGGDPARYAAAAGAYTALRTVTGRREACADLGGRLRRGRPAVLALRVAAAAAVSAGALAVAGPQPGSLGLIAGALTWLIRTGRRELGSRRRQTGPDWTTAGEASSRSRVSSVRISS